MRPDFVGAGDFAAARISAQFPPSPLVDAEKRRAVEAPRLASLPVLGLESFAAQNFSHLPEGFVELHVLVNAFDRPAFRHPASVRPSTGIVALPAPDDVLLNCVQRGPEVFLAVSVTAVVIVERRAGPRFFVSFSHVLPPAL